MFRTPILLIGFVLRDNMLYVVVKDRSASFHLSEYGFYADREVSAGAGGNHLLKDSGPLRDIKAFIKDQLSRKEYILLTLMWYEGRAVVITDRHLDNMAIMHLVHVTEQCGVRRCDVYYERQPQAGDMAAYMRSFMQQIAGKDLVGSSHSPKTSGYYYKIPDNSIELGEARRIDANGELIK